MCRQSLKLEEITRLIEGELIGDPDIEVRGIAALDEPIQDFISFSNERFFDRISEKLDPKQLPQALIVRSMIAPDPNASFAIPIIRVKNPLKAVVKLIPYFFEKPRLPVKISPLASVDPSAEIEANVTIAPFSFVGAGVSVGSDTVIHPNVVVYPNVKIGQRCTIHSGAVLREGVRLDDDCTIQNGAVIGGDGFGYYFEEGQGLVPVPQVGTVELGKKVEVGANTAIDRATLGTTTVSHGTKIDNLVQIGHNTKVGQHTIICGCAAIAGSCEIGDQVVLGGGVGVKDHVKIASRVRLGARSGVTESIENSGDYAGFPSVPIYQWRRQLKAIRELPEKLKLIKERYSNRSPEG